MWRKFVRIFNLNSERFHIFTIINFWAVGVTLVSYPCRAFLQEVARVLACGGRLLPSGFGAPVTL
jgi:hypothetical protein